METCQQQWPDLVQNNCVLLREHKVRAQKDINIYIIIYNVLLYLVSVKYRYSRFLYVLGLYYSNKAEDIPIV